MAFVDGIDRLTTLPLELRERIYLFLGFPVVKEWYHACEDRIVPLVKIEHVQGPSRRATTIHYVDKGGTITRCSDEHTGRDRALMATNSFYNAELSSLLYSSVNAQLTFVVGEIGKIDDGEEKERKDFLWLAWKEFEQSGTPPAGFQSRRFKSPYDARNLIIPMVWLWRAPQYHGEHLLGIGASAEDLNTIRLAKLVEFARALFANLENLRLDVKNLERQSDPSLEIFHGRHALSHSIALSLCHFPMLKTFHLRTPSYPSRKDTFFGSPAYRILHTTIIDVQAISPADRYQATSPSLMYACSRPAEYMARKRLHHCTDRSRPNGAMGRRTRYLGYMAVLGYSWVNKCISTIARTDTLWENIQVNDIAMLCVSNADSAQAADQTARSSHMHKRAHVVRILTGWADHAAPLYTSWDLKEDCIRFCELSRTGPAVTSELIKRIQTRY